MDTDGDGTADYEVYVQNEPSTDLLTAYLVDLATGDLIDLQPANFADGNIDTNVFDTTTLLIPVWPKAIGMTDADSTFPISYTVRTSGIYGSDSLDGAIDRTPPVTFDVANPKVQVRDPLYCDGGGVGVPYRLGASAAAPATSTGGGASIGVPAPSVAAAPDAAASQVQAPEAQAPAGNAPAAADTVAGDRGHGGLTPVQLGRRVAPATSAAGAKALILHLHGQSGSRAEVLALHG